MNAPLPAWRYDDLVREGLGLIPAHAPGWTDHNPSDPGITLVELLAYFTELLAYRLGRVTPRAKLQFLRLLEGSPHADAPADDIDGAIARAVDAMSRGECAVTAADFERLAVEAARAHLGPGQVVDAVCLPGADRGRRGGRRSDPRSRVSVIVLPQAELDAGATARLCDAVQQALAPRCLLSTRVQVDGPALLHLGLGFRLVLRRGSQRPVVLNAIATRLQGMALSLGATVRITDITELIDNTDGVDHVENVFISGLSSEVERLFDAESGVGIQIAVHSTPGVDARLGLLPGLDPQRLQRDDAGRLSAITLRPWEVARLHLAPGAVDVVEPGANDGGR